MKKIFLLIITVLFYSCNFFDSVINSDSEETQPSYSVYYDGNGYTGGTVPEPQDFNVGDIITAQAGSSLQKNGYVFTGWNTEPDGSGVQHNGASEWAMEDSDIILYARWTEGSEQILSIAYNSNGGDTFPVDNNRYVAGDSVTLSDAGTMTNAGYTFAGWNTESDRSGTEYGSAETITITESIRLFACWDS